MARKTENQLRQEIAEVWALLDAERAGRAALIRRIEQERDELRKDAERYRKLRGWMSSNVKEGWGRVTDLSAVFCYVSWQEGDSYLDNLPECNVGLMQKDAAIAQGQTK